MLFKKQSFFTKCQQTKHILLLIVLCAVFCIAQAAEVETYTYPSQVTLDSRFTVSVNGQNVPVVQSKRTFAHFSFSGTVTVKVSGIGSHTLSPKAFAIDVDRSQAGAVSFTLNRPRYLVLHENHSNELVIFADPLEYNPPTAERVDVFEVTETDESAIVRAIDKVNADPRLRVVYVPAGYRKSKPISIKSNMEVYLAGGAVVEFTSSIGLPNNNHESNVAFIHAENAFLRGRGMIIATNGSHAVAPYQSKNIHMDGIVSTWGKWNTVTRQSDEVTISNWKAMAGDR